MRFSFCLRYVEIAFAFRTFNFRRSAAHESSHPSTPILTPKPTKCFRSLRCSTTQFMTDADEDRQRRQQGRRQTRQDMIYDRDSSHLWVPDSDCGDRFSNHHFRRDSKSSTHIANSTFFPRPLVSAPRTVCILVRVREGGTRDKDGEGGKGREKRKREITREKTRREKVVSGVSGVCVCFFCVCCGGTNSWCCKYNTSCT